MKTKNETISNLGTIENRSGVFHAVDAHINDHIFQATVMNVAKGRWDVDAIFSKWGNQEICKGLQLCHQSLGDILGDDLDFEAVEESIGIDTGTIKIIDADTKNNPVPEKLDMAELLIGGVITSSGLGDGLYFVDVCRNPSGEVVGLFIDFIHD